MKELLFEREYENANFVAIASYKSRVSRKWYYHLEKGETIAQIYQDVISKYPYEFFTAGMRFEVVEYRFGTAIQKEF